MSIFLAVMRDLVVKSLEAIKVRIERDDHSLKSVFRNKEIPEFKKTLASETIKFTQELAEGLSNERLRETVVFGCLKYKKMLTYTARNEVFLLGNLDWKSIN